MPRLLLITLPLLLHAFSNAPVCSIQDKHFPQWVCSYEKQTIDRFIITPSKGVAHDVRLAYFKEKLRIALIQALNDEIRDFFAYLATQSNDKSILIKTKRELLLLNDISLKVVNGYIHYRHHFLEDETLYLRAWLNEDEQHYALVEAMYKFAIYQSIPKDQVKKLYTKFKAMTSFQQRPLP